jgi:hypothetical protein
MCSAPTIPCGRNAHWQFSICQPGQGFGNVLTENGAPPHVPPQTLRRQAQRFSRFGGRALRSGRPDADLIVDVGGDVGWMLKVTAAPALTAAVHGQAAPAQRVNLCAASWLVRRLSVSWLL